MKSLKIIHSDMVNYCNKYDNNVGTELEKNIKEPESPFQINLNNSLNASINQNNTSTNYHTLKTHKN